jgi:uncharacterized membrane protein YgdD (TMEM256/DUF423 family)
MNWLVIAAINLTLCIATGAFAAHGLKARLSLEQMAWWQTAVSYHTTHALGLLAIGIMLRFSSALSPSLAAAGLNTSALLLQLGIVVFSGSLYAMALGAPRWFGAITPIGGLAFMAGWLWLAWTVSR